MSLVYNGEHQICFWKKNFLPSTFTIGDRYTVDEPKFSWDDFHLVPLVRPFVAESKPNYSIVSIANSNKRMNITPYLPGGMTYESRTGEWEFAIDHDRWGNWIVSHHELENYFNGSKMLVALNDDPSKIYEGRISLKEYTPGDSYSKIKIAYDLDPENLSSTQLSGVLFRVRFIGPYNTVLQGMLNSYGSAPYYGGTVPSPEGTSFEKWSPSPNSVVGNADYKAEYKSTSTNVNLPPVRIEVTTLPNVTTYGQGAFIGFDGIEVTAYDREDNVWSIVPINELIFPVTVAEYDPSTDVPAGGEKSSDLATGFVHPIPYQLWFIGVDDNGNKSEISTEISTAYGIIGYHSGTIQNYIVAGKTPGACTLKIFYANDPAHPIIYPPIEFGTGSPYVRDGKAVYYASVQFGYHPASGEAELKVGETKNDAWAAWTIMYGDGEEHGSGSRQEITVKWKPPVGNSILETSFDIIVIPPPSGTND